MKFMTILIPLLIAAVAATPGILALRAQKRKQDAEVADILTKASGVWVERYGKRVEELEQEAEEHRQEVEALNGRIDSLTKALHERDVTIRCLNDYIEHLLSGIRRLMAQSVARGDQPSWEPHDFKEFGCNDPTA
jgi:chromosome segregation ATPase